jgi:hypothetical protein
VLDAVEDHQPGSFEPRRSTSLAGRGKAPIIPKRGGSDAIFGLLCCEFRRLSGGIEFSFGYHLVWNAVSETGIMPNFQWYDNSYGTLHFINQINGWSIGALYLGGLLLLLFVRLYRGQYATRLLMPRGTAMA